MPEHTIRDVLEMTMVIAVGGMCLSTLHKLRRGSVHVPRCGACGKTVSRAYASCMHCGIPR